MSEAVRQSNDVDAPPSWPQSVGESLSPVLLLLVVVVGSAVVAGCSRLSSEPLVADVGAPDPPPAIVETTVVMTTTGPPDVEQPEIDRVDDDGPVATSMAALVDASTVIFGGEGYGATDAGTWDGHLDLWRDGELTRLGPLFGGAWVDDDFIYVVKAESGAAWIHDHDGFEVCSVQLDEGETVHHATQRDDGSIVLGLEQWEDADPIGSYNGIALDCESGERVAIEPMSQALGDGEWIAISRVADRTFEVSGDAEGNAAVIRTEAGVDLVADDDWAGLIAFADDAATIAYGDQAGSFSPHVTNQLKVRDATDGRLLWSAELPQLISGLWFVGDALVVGQGDDDGGWIPTDSVIAFDVATGTNLGSAPSPEGLLYIG